MVEHRELDGVLTGENIYHRRYSHVSFVPKFVSLPWKQFQTFPRYSGKIKTDLVDLGEKIILFISYSDSPNPDDSYSELGMGE